MAKTAIITGGSRGLGKAMSLKLGELGYNVVINYVSDSSKAKAEEIAEQLKKDYGVEGLVVRADVSKYEDCEALVKAALDKFGDNIDVLVNNAGITNNCNWIDIKHEQYEKVIATNLMSLLHMTHLVLPHMVNHSDKEHQCQIVNISSVGGLTGVINQADYCAAKSGVIGLTRALALEFAGRGVRSNAIAPGMIMTDMLRGVNQDELNALAATIPEGYIGDVSDIAGALEYILKAPYLTGQVISPNGGFVLQ
ncbi:short-chain dehydrogenase [Oribacterium sp. C9]|uniref:SDR family NAD(P)-dependent oxidoreductase n=1 Tax=Oribacterium sp. C9 TaxID=1943579 RepID=UPI00098F524B|nr:3-oxoacyl-ACP reductase family protein [Oribacterium sp. C9]OON85895.1 short-chain dehydrogenase [Oribacterium sp. C9]